MTESEKGSPAFISGKWSDPTYRAAFSGVENFRKALNKDFGLSLSKRQIIGTLKTLPGFVNKIKQKKLLFSGNMMSEAALIHGKQIWLLCPNLAR